MNNGTNNERKRSPGHQRGTPLLRKDAAFKKEVIRFFHKSFGGPYSGKEVINLLASYGYSCDYKTLRRYIADLKKDETENDSLQYIDLSENEKLIILYFRGLSSKKRELYLKLLHAISTHLLDEDQVEQFIIAQVRAQ